MKNILLYLTVSATLVVSSCRSGDDGEPGPAGASYFRTEGTASGTIYYEYPNGDTAIVPVSFGSFTSDADNVFYLDSTDNFGYDYYAVDIKRVDPTDGANFFRFSICNATFDRNRDSSYRPPYNIDFAISVVKPGNPFFQFTNMYNIYSDYETKSYYVGEDAEITNYYLNPVTRVLSFRYKFYISPNDIPYNLRVSSYPAIVSGNVQVQLNKSTYELNNCNAR
ncbi:MAG: hypothetical protein MUE33_00110 [Cytophagaceae bacterium]|jgi:hypothetical protein|nr:hypothetical protein [Cytophagaceae bacterium]